MIIAIVFVLYRVAEGEINELGVVQFAPAAVSTNPNEIDKSINGMKSILNVLKNQTKIVMHKIDQINLAAYNNGMICTMFILHITHLLILSY
jgi:hypothetical protein